MGKFSAKNKVIILFTSWLAVSLVMFLFIFGILDESNQKIVDSMAKQRQELALLKAEKASYLKAQQDLQTLAKKQYQPDNFFSKDVALVKEIETLETWADKVGVQMQLSGISGTVATAAKAKTATSIAMVPYGINLNGSLEQVVNYIEVLENLGFVTNLTSVSLSSADRGTVSANLTANFYLSK
ncbi:MAG: hypothetical protein HY918_00965 [Candidatus Doudnabacteria bacterium]|nr:hypothetical protein [Candidatus Doudnabacteria bacterium]